MNKSRLKGVAAVVLASMCYGVTPILTNIALKGGLPLDFARRIFGEGAPSFLTASSETAIPNESVVMLGMLLGCLISLITALISKKGKLLLDVKPKALLSMTLLGGGTFAATMLLISYAYRFMEPGSVIVLHFSYPVIACAAAALFFGERFTVYKAAAAVFAAAGIYLVSGFCGADSFVGPLLALLSAFAYAAYFLLGKHSAYADVDSSVSGVYITLGAAAAAFVAALVSGRLALPSNAFLWLVLAMSGLIGYLIGLRLLLYGIKVLGSGTAAMLNTLEPVMATLSSIAVFGESMGLMKGLGCALVLLGTIITAFGSLKQQTQ